ncbi:hypothetical protein [Phenylobacterium sp.]|uniref:hypothetical protein n=1 Tax=Phenylobacterium sp. TaxID=1871053 RepID=UPI0027304AEB|nr:hypothetical protein [Phenylobacterium sp.]MDP1873179.1 hypothetical protein [Phenylobacterium sp.]
MGVALGLLGNVATATAEVPLNSDHRILGGPELIALARSVENFKPKDAFSAAPDQSALAGKRFRIDLPVPEDRTPGWSYDVARQQLEVRVEGAGLYFTRDVPQPFDSEAGGRLGAFHVFWETTTKGEGYTGTNAFGGTADVRSQSVRQYGLAEFSKGPTLTDRQGLALSAAMAPGEARALVPNLRLRVEGSLSPIKGAVVACFSHYTEATFSLPEEEFRRMCLISTKVDALSIIDARTGALLQRWDARSFAPQ